MYSSYQYGQPRKSGADKLPLILLFLALGAVIALDKFLIFGFNWVDYTAVGVVFFCAFAGYIKGLIGTMFSLASYIIAAICAALFSPALAQFIMDKTGVGDKVAQSIGDQIAGLGLPAFNQSVDMSQLENIDQLFSEHPELSQYLSQNEMMKQLFEKQNPLASGILPTGNQITSISDLLVLTVLKVIAVIAIFILVKIVVSIIGRVINSAISRNAFLSTTNKTIGMALGVGVGCIIVFVVISYIMPFIGSLNFVKIPDAYTQSKVLGFFFSDVS